MADLQARDIKLIQYLNEAYGKEKQLETALEAHIAMTTRAPYKKRLQQHLRETKAHGRDVQRRIKQLGAVAEEVNVPGPEAITEAATRAVELARKGLAAMQGPVHVLRGTGEQEKLLKNAKTQFQDEAEEIASYTAIATLAEVVGDRETARLAKRIRREEERMRDFLRRQIDQLTKAVATEEIPAAERRSGRRRAGRRRTTTSGRRRTTTSRSRATARRSTSRSTSRGTSARGRSTSRSGGRSTSRSGGRSTSRSTGSTRSGGRRTSSGRSASRSTRGRSTSARSGGSRRSSSARSGSSTRRSTSRSSGSSRRSSGGSRRRSSS